MSFSARQRDIVASVMADRGTPGVAAAIVQDGEIVAAEGFGYRNLEDQLPMTAGTVSPICSLSKSFTGVAIMQLVESGLLWLDEPVISYLPGYRVADPEASRKITPRMLLSHKSGMGRTGHQARMFDEGTPPPYRDRTDLVSRLAGVQLQTPPNASFSYCNEAYVTLSVLLETLTHQTLEDHEERRIFGAVGMQDSFTRFAQWRAAADRVTNYLKDGEHYRQGYLPEDYGIYLASGSVCSSAMDLARYLIATMDYDSSPLLSSGSLDQMHTISNPYGDTGWGYGFGWEVGWSGRRKVLSHGGGLSGINTHMLIVPSERLGVVVLTNLSGGGPDEIAELLAGAVLGTPLFRAATDDALPISSRYPAPDVTSLAAYSGRYANGEAQVDLLLDHEQLHVAVRRTHGTEGEEAKPVIFIGPDQLMTIQDANVAFMVRDTAGDVIALLAGGDRYQRVERADT